jgi:hypothetical protein
MEGPGVLRGSSMACLQGAAYLIGGHSSIDFPRSLSLANTNGSVLWALGADGRWQAVAAGGTPPPPMAYSSMAVLGDDLFVFGGITARFQLSHALWRFSTASKSWSLQMTLDAARSMHTLTAVTPNRLFLHGGYGAAVNRGLCTCVGCKATGMWSDESCALQLPYACTRNSSFRPQTGVGGTAQQATPSTSIDCELVRVRRSTNSDGIYSKTDYVSFDQPVYVSQAGLYLYFYGGYWAVSSDYTSLVLAPQDQAAARVYINAPSGGKPQSATGTWSENIGGVWVSSNISVTCEVSDSFWCTRGVVLRGQCWSAVMPAATYAAAEDACALWSGTVALLNSDADATYFDQLTLAAPAWTGVRWYGSVVR